ncbi:MAG: energy transducer TonB [Chryseotalea sp. WA131a]|jgi:TonB family protein|nr:MAG: energy transducer TonB [Chryseotalea sp. WA131a]
MILSNETKKYVKFFLFYTGILLFSGCAKGDKRPDKALLACKNCEEVIFGASGLTLLPDHFARYPNGSKGIQEFISTNINYPELAKKKGIQGRVIISFKVDTAGSIVDTKLIKGVNQELDKEALRVVKLMSGWYPAIKDGKYVAIEYKLPIVYSF